MQFHGFFSNKNFVLTRTLPAVICALLLNLGGLGLLYWTTQEADRVAYERQNHLFERVIADLRNQIAHDQESVTVWDDALNAVRAGDGEWIEWNLGIWMQEYFDHNALFVLAPDDRLLHAYIVDDPQYALDYSKAETTILHLVDILRTRMRENDGKLDAGAYLQTPGAVDVALVDGRPTIVSAKAIVSDSGDIAQVPGEEYVFVSVRYLDGKFLTETGRKFLFDGLRFSVIDRTQDHEASNRLVDMNSQTIGHFFWSPYRPGSAVFSYLLPMLAALGLLLLILIGFFALQLRVRYRKQRLAERQMYHMARHDSLTGLPNRSCFNDVVDDVLMRDDRDVPGIALLFIDLDHFKQVNDTMGHPGGDVMIRAVAGRLRAAVLPGSIIARVGGDEFTLLLTNIADLPDAEAFCENLFASGNAPVEVNGRLIPVRMSIGVAFDPDGNLGRDELIRRADVALYRAKAKGRNCYVAFDPEMDAANREKRRIEHDLRAALDVGAGQLRLQFQPLYALPDETLLGFEALARWEHPELGDVRPDLFIPIAEETGMIREIGAWALRSACEAALHWPGVGISVNVSVLEFDDPDYVERVRAILNETGFDPARLVLEVTETVMASGESSERILGELKDIGVMIAIDDFGTGFSSLGRLRNLEVDIIKIDRIFIDQIDISMRDRELVRAIIEFAHMAGMEATAEGVENASQLDCLRLIGCDNVQGFYYSRPIDAHLVDQLVHARRVASNAN